MKRKKAYQSVKAETSNISGIGLFARHDFAAGDALYCVTVIREITTDEPLDEDAGENPHHCAYPDGKILLYAKPDCFMNHSCDPNAWYDYTNWEHDGAATVRARRDIKAGEEVTVDYLINTAQGDSWPCTCRAARCRGFTAKGFFDLPADVQTEYAPLLAPWFVERHRDELVKHGLI